MARRMPRLVDPAGIRSRPVSVAFGELAIAAGLVGESITVASDFPANTQCQIWKYYTQALGAGNVIHARAKKDIKDFESRLSDIRAVGFQMGQSAEILPSDVGRPMLADDVAIEFPDLRINLSHTGWPWVDEWCSMLWRHPNVYGDISAYYAKSLDERLVKFMNSSRGRDKVLFGTNSLGLQRCKEELIALDISEDTKHKVLHDNAVRFLKLDEA